MKSCFLFLKKRGAKSNTELYIQLNPYLGACPVFFWETAEYLTRLVYPELVEGLVGVRGSPCPFWAGQSTRLVAALYSIVFILFAFLFQSITLCSILDVIILFPFSFQETPHK